MMAIAICALTYERTDGLDRLLAGLGQQTAPSAPAGVTIVVVDNDPQASAQALCRDWSARLPWPLKYVVEPRAGIAFARNAALEAARDADWLCFVDDDEVPTPDWLEELLKVQRAHDADVVGGPVIPYFDRAAPDWIVQGGFFNRPRYPTGTRLSHAFTNNVLFRRSILDDLGIRFDSRWALIGCEDRHFFQQIGMAGYRIVWADEAVVVEWIPSSRANARWLVQRRYRVGNATSLVELDLRPGWRRRPALLLKSLVWWVIGAWWLTIGVALGKGARLRGRRDCAYAAGMFAGLLGIRYEEYRRRHEVPKSPRAKAEPP